MPRALFYKFSVMRETPSVVLDGLLLGMDTFLTVPTDDMDVPGKTTNEPVAVVMSIARYKQLAEPRKS